uniref:Uncharacterized protein n=1 Tax=viral metagenome TaxID=1070528 RepID=A0A6M3J074_9ZZZZ
MKWLSKNLWIYLFERPAYGCSKFTAFFCRLGNHRAGVIWFNPHGLEPDMHCRKMW